MVSAAAQFFRQVWTSAINGSPFPGDPPMEEERHLKQPSAPSRLLPADAGLQGTHQALSGTKPVLPRLSVCRGRTTASPRLSASPGRLPYGSLSPVWLVSRFSRPPDSGGIRMMAQPFCGSGRFSSLQLSCFACGLFVCPGPLAVPAHAAVWRSRGRSAAISCAG